MFFLNIMKRRWFILPIMTVLIFGVLYYQRLLRPVLSDSNLQISIKILIIYIPAVASLFTCFIFNNNDETELATASGYPMQYLMLNYYAPILIYTYIPLFCASIIILPPWICGRIIISTAIILIFITSLVLLFRLIINNTYANIGFAAAINITFMKISEILSSGSYSPTYCIIDPYLSSYMFKIYAPSRENIWEISDNIWIANIMFFTVFSLVLLFSSVILAKKRQIKTIL